MPVGLQRRGDRRDLAVRKAVALEFLVDLGIVGGEPGRARVVVTMLRVGGAEQQRLELPRHVVARAVDARADGGPIRQAHDQAQACTIHGVDGKRVSLFVANQLHRVLRLAQHQVRVGQFRNIAGRHELRAGQQRQHLEQRGALQAPVAAAAHQLHGLHDEFDLADAAAAEFQMLIEFAPRHLPGDQRLHVAQRLEYAEVEIAPIHERAHEFLIRRRVGFQPNDGPCLDPGVALPIAAMLLQVIFERSQARHQRTAFAEWPQAHVHAKHEPVLVPRIEQPNEFTAEPGEIFFVFDLARPIGLARLREQEHEVDVGGEIQFAPAQLTHAQHDQRHLLALRAARPAEYRLEMHARRRRRCPNARIREIRKRSAGSASRRHARRCRTTRCATFRGAATRARCAAPPGRPAPARRVFHIPRSRCAPRRARHGGPATRAPPDPGSMPRR